MGLGQNISSAGQKSAARLAFVHYLRTGRRLPESAFAPAAPETKFNPYHDPRNGQFTFAPGGPRSLSRIVISNGRQAAGGDAPSIAAGRSNAPGGKNPTPAPSNADGIWRDAQEQGPLRLAQYRPTPPRRARGNIESFWDPMTLQQVFPGLQSAPAGAILTVADNLLNLTGPADTVYATLSEAYANHLINQIRKVDPKYRYDSFSVSRTRAGQINKIRQLRLDRAFTLYRMRGDTGPLQVETLRFLQERVNAAYKVGVQEFAAGRLEVRLSREEAIGNFADLAIRRETRVFYNSNGIVYQSDPQVRVVGREYDTSGTDRTYRIPDVRVGKIAFDVTLTRKTLTSKQIRGFFNADFKPDAVVIVRPRQLGPGITYTINRPRM